jgi:hypothetical protein
MSVFHWRLDRARRYFKQRAVWLFSSVIMASAVAIWSYNLYASMLGQLGTNGGFADLVDSLTGGSSAMVWLALPYSVASVFGVVTFALAYLGLFLTERLSHHPHPKLQ